MNYKRITDNVSWQTIVALCIIVVGFSLLNYYTPVMGDDLAKWRDLGLEDYKFFRLSTLKYVGQHYLGCNGRILDSVGPIITNALPGPLTAAVMGLMCGVYFFAVVAASNALRRGRATLSCLIIFATILVMPWWDSMWLRACQFNYVWSTAFCIIFFILFTRLDNGGKTSFADIIGYVVVGVLTAFTHEETGVSSFCAMVFYMLVNRGSFRFNARTVTLAASLVFGLACVLLSPGIWNRFGRADVNVGVAELLTTTLPAVCLLSAILLSMACFKAGRRRISGSLKSPFAAFVAVAYTASVIAVHTRIIGRTGWLPETAAIICIALVCANPKYRLNKDVAAVGTLCLMSAIIVHLAATVALQKKLYEEYDSVFNEYVESADGIVYHDILARPDFPKIALNHAQGVPDADDFYLLDVMAEVYRPDTRPLVVLPAEFKGKIDCLKDSVSINGYTVYSELPADVKKAVSEDGRYTILVQHPGPGQRIVKPVLTARGKELWVASPLIIDKGDHWIMSED